MKIYTKTGDKGDTGMLGGVRISKAHPAVKVCGSLDETNSFLGLARSEKLSKHVDQILVTIQHDLFDLGSRVAGCLAESSRVPEFPESRASELENLIDQFQDKLPQLTAFILPSGSRAGSSLHLARSVCRRSERELVEMIELDSKVELSTELVYLNRLGDLLFVLARIANQESGSTETQWDVGRGQQ